jgi:hypothetical protein
MIRKKRAPIFPATNATRLRGSCSNKKVEQDDNSKQNEHDYPKFNSLKKSLPLSSMMKGEAKTISRLKGRARQGK